jgi:hypothetical protein
MVRRGKIWFWFFLEKRKNKQCLLCEINILLLGVEKIIQIFKKR